MNTAGGDDIEIRFEKISRPLEVKKIISDKQTEKVPVNVPAKKMRRK
jgi:hypothetical protein